MLSLKDVMNMYEAMFNDYQDQNLDMVNLYYQLNARGLQLDKARYLYIGGQDHDL